VAGEIARKESSSDDSDHLSIIVQQRRSHGASIKRVCNIEALARRAKLLCADQEGLSQNSIIFRRGVEKETSIGYSYWRRGTRQRLRILQTDFQNHPVLPAVPCLHFINIDKLSLCKDSQLRRDVDHFECSQHSALPNEET